MPFASAERSTPASLCELSGVVAGQARPASLRGTTPLRFASAERSTPARVTGTATSRPASLTGTAPLSFASPVSPLACWFRQRGTFHTGKPDRHRTRPLRQRGTFHTGSGLSLAFSGDCRLMDLSDSASTVNRRATVNRQLVARAHRRVRTWSSPRSGSASRPCPTAIGPSADLPQTETLRTGRGTARPSRCPSAWPSQGAEEPQ